MDHLWLLTVRSGRRVPALQSLLLSLSLLVSWVGAGEPRPPARPEGQSPSRPAPETQAPPRVFHYTMSGGVRILLFWANRDDVGGGRIVLSGEPDSAPSTWREEVQVLFGSKPERVPGKVNRWGYGREWSTWRRGEAGSRPVPLSSVFEGFIRHSSEETADQVAASVRSENDQQSYWYDGMRSTVLEDRALADVRIFATSSDFDYRNPDPIFESYRLRLAAGPPDRTRQIDRRTGPEAVPCGFLTAMRLLILRLTADPASLNELKAGGSPKSLIYYYGARPYRLRIRKVRDPEDFEAPAVRGMSAGDERSIRFQRVSRVSFQVLNLQNQSRSDFDLWVPLEGPLRGIPLRIEHKPRWWLRVRLDLILDPAGNPVAGLDAPEQSGS
ncbi:MAG: hypothetical protein WAO20_00610 [Acidobacteriota bacterium]